MCRLQGCVLYLLSESFQKIQLIHSLLIVLTSKISAEILSLYVVEIVVLEQEGQTQLPKGYKFPKKLVQAKELIVNIYRKKML